ncbi:MAG: WYL domain-containing transcriptional regulator [Oscillospiraceae bacterium]|nr:WYL domain-containing transcriptional regulator [Oscillospiraceae bacterium]
MAEIKESASVDCRQRLKLLYLRDILLRYTNENQSLTRTEIEEMLNELGISEGRKAFAEDIDALKSYGMDIQSTVGRKAGYRLASREFELAELKLLADAVSSAKFLTSGKAAELIKKLSGLCSESEAAQLCRNVYVTDRTGISSSHIMYSVDTINQAISAKGTKRKIRFRYFEYDIHKKKKYRVPDRICTPYALVWDNTHYYLVAWNDHRECYSNYRVDRMENVEIIREKARPIDRDFDLSEYVRTHISMFSGEETEVKLRCSKEMVNSVLDRFGMKTRFIPDKDEEHFVVYVNVVAKSPFFAWLFQFGEKAQLLGPDSVRKEYAEMLDKVRSGIEE